MLDPYLILFTECLCVNLTFDFFYFIIIFFYFSDV